MKYDFSWIENEVNQWQDFLKKDKEILKRALNCIPFNLTFYEGAIWTHLNEDINDYDDYWNQRNKFYDYLIEKYT